MINTPATWNAIIASLPGAHLLQTWEWAQIKVRFGWESIFALWSDSGVCFVDRLGTPVPGFDNFDVEKHDIRAAALVLKRSLRLPGLSRRLCMLYIPRGPLLNWDESGLCQRVFNDLYHFARQEGAVLIKIDPDLPVGRGIPDTAEAEDDLTGQLVMARLISDGWRFSNEQVQFRNTVLVDLNPDESQILAGMKQKTRYNIRLAERKGVSVRQGTLQDLDLLYHMYAETSVRDNFVIRSAVYYKTLWSEFYRGEVVSPPSVPQAVPLLAEVDGEAVAGIVVFHFALKAWYLHGMSYPRQRERMPNYLVQWEAMRRAKAAGCTIYDLWGAPDTFIETDPMWGVFRFKQGLGGEVVRTLGAWDFPIRPLFYKIYTQVLPPLMGVLRQRGRARTQSEI